MRSTVIPAQITTVEDTIAANLNLTQILLFMVPVFTGGAIYSLVPPKLHLDVIKLVIWLAIAIVFSTLAIRIKGKILLEWLSIIVRYNLRPRFYIFDKNDQSFRDLVIPLKTKPAISLAKLTQAKKHKTTHKAVIEQTNLEQILLNNRFSTRFSFKENGALHVALEQVTP